MRGREATTALLAVAAVALPGAVLHAMAGPGRRAWGLTAAPFGEGRLLAAQLVAALPLAVLLARALPLRPANRPGPADLIGLPLAAVLAVVVARGGATIAGVLDGASAGFVARAIGRSALALLVLAPAAPAVARRLRGAAPPAPAALVVAGLLAVLPPAALADRLGTSRLRAAEAAMDTGRLARARADLGAAAELGRAGTLRGRPPAQASRSLDDALAGLRRAASYPLAPDASPKARLDRAFLLVRLDRLDEAGALLAPLAPTDPAAALLRAAVLRDGGRWAECERAYREILAVLAPKAVRSPLSREGCATAYEGLAEAARRRGDPEAAEAAYRDAARLLPERAAAFALLLGRHYQDGGRPAAALAQFDEAVRLDPALAPTVALLARRVRVGTPACLVSRSP
jgi:tetratricopeptide (TPR) repeat protein